MLAENSVRRVADHVEQELPTRLARDLGDSLVSVSLVGSMATEPPTIGLVNDMDVVVVSGGDPATDTMRIEQTVAALCQELAGDPSLDLTHTLLRGPIKPAASGRPVLQIHCIPTTKDRLARTTPDAPRLTYNSWRIFNRPLYGALLTQLIKIPRIGLRDVLEDERGLPQLRIGLTEMAAKERQALGDGSVVDVEFSWKLNARERAEAAMYGTLTAAWNTIEALYPHIITEHYERPAAAREFGQTFGGLPMAGWPVEVHRLCEQHRCGELLLTPESVARLTRKTDAFLGSLEKAIAEIRG
ncbi:MAG: hypothetical protein HYT16_02310 [DPANN group archaeon]|nr:hypothetical protein [DPANN group archaeon]